MIRHFSRLVLLLVFLMLLGAVVAAWYIQLQWDKPMVAQAQVYTIAPGSSIRKVSSELHRLDIMPDPYSFALLGRYTEQATKLKAGDYQLTENMTPRQMLDKFVKGDVITFKVSLVEGLTFRQFRQALAAAEGLEKISGDWSDEKIMDQLGAAQIHPEGQFFPDTYVYRGGESDLDVLKQAHRRMQDELDALWQKRPPDSPLNSKYQALILASIIEKETGQADERPTIGGVFTNRLNKGMLLQTDPTIIYGLGDAFDGNLTRKHLKDASNPYNTYVHGGLPPTPIAMPGGASLKAAVLPEQTDYYYFVARGDGSHQFSPTYKAHQKAVNEYQLKRKSRG